MRRFDLKKGRLRGKPKGPADQELDPSFATRGPTGVGVGLPRWVVDRPEVTIHFWVFSACRIEPVPWAVKALSPNHWTAREFPGKIYSLY